MAGHSKWANIRHRKGAQDAKRGKIYSKLVKEISVAVKTGGVDPECNPRLRLAIQNAKSQNMPKDNVERAIKKASGEGAENFVETTFEGYGPDGVAIFVECATDNNTRSVANVRSYFNKNNGSLGKDGCLQFIFDRKGIFTFNAEDIEDEDEFTMEMIDAGAEDVEVEDGMVTVITAMENFGSASKKIQELNLESIDAGLKRVPTTYKEISEQAYPTFMKLIDLLEDDEDVQNVYHNVEFDESFMS